MEIKCFTKNCDFAIKKENFLTFLDCGHYMCLNHLKEQNQEDGLMLITCQCKQESIINIKSIKNTISANILITENLMRNY
jgi:hypothetical protein